MKVSVIVPVHNVKPYLERCVKSVLGQTYKDVEIILVDDGSTDGSGELCDELASRYGIVSAIHQNNQGISGARNVGLHRATGEYAAFLDADDAWLLPDGLEQLVKEAEDTKSDLIIFKCVHIYSGTKRVPAEDYDIKHLHSLHDGSAVFDNLVRTQKFNMSACFLLARRELLIDNEIHFPLGLISEDVYWSLHLWQHAMTVTVTNLEFYGYYHRQESVTTTVTIQAYESYDTIFTYWKAQCDQGCKNAEAIRIYLANMWVNRGYCYFIQDEKEKPNALRVLERHKDLLNYGVSPKSIRVRLMVRYLGVKRTAEVLGYYWRLRTWFIDHAL